MARLPILMYHNVSLSSTDSRGLTIAVETLDQHFAYLAKNGYQTFHFSELQNYHSEKKLPKKSVIITFDDVYVNQLQLAYPLLKKHHLKATFFIPFKYVDGVDSWNSNSEKIMSVDQLKFLDESIVELGLHSYNHQNYTELTIDEIDSDFEQCKSYIRQYQLPVNNVLAYPFGKYPKRNPEQKNFFKCLHKHQMAYGLRIGNRVNAFPFKNNYEVQRIDIKGEDTLAKFKLKLRFGKLKLF